MWVDTAYNHICIMLNVCNVRFSLERRDGAPLLVKDCLTFFRSMHLICNDFINLKLNLKYVFK